MSQRNSRQFAAALTLAGLLSVLPLSQLEADPRARRAQHKQDLWQRVEQQVSVLWGQVGRIWEKVGARIDDNGARILNGTSFPDDGLAPVGKPAPSLQ